MKRNQRLTQDTKKFKKCQIKLDFYKNISYIKYMEKTKEKILQHPRNQRVVFDEDKHTYHVDGKRYSGVTGWIGKFCSPFNAKKIAKKLSENVDGWMHLTPEEILEVWNEAREYGNYVDKLVEDYVNKGIDSDEPELQQFKLFLEEYELTPVMAQWVIFNEDLKRASAIDVVCLNKDGKAVIIDLKTMEKDVKASAYQGKKMAYPLLLPESKYYKFCLQLGIYQDWVEKKYGVETHHTNYVLRIRPEFYEVIPTMNVKKQIKALEEFENEN